MKNLKYIFFAAIIMLSQSCDNWLDVRPEDAIGEDELFKSYEGVEKIKNGIYLSLSDGALYADNLGGGLLDVMGQLYSINEKSGTDQNQYNNHVNYEYNNEIVKMSMESVWTGLYSIIANINNLLEKSTLYKEHYTEIEYNTIRGELLGLRAYLHFDALRLFGPMPKDENREVTSIPYYTTRTVSAAPLLTFDQVMNHVQEDLVLAESLLHNDDVFNGMNARRYRMNYLSVKALQARVALYNGDKVQAARLARLLVGEAGGLLSVLNYNMPWINSSSATSPTAPDRYFSSEVIFGIENSQRQSYYLSDFEYNVELSKFLAPTITFYESLTFDKVRDYRLSSWRTNPGNGRALEFAKYHVVNELKSSVRYVQPLIRRSELILILAESTTDQTEATNALNELYINRGYQSGSVQGYINQVGLEKFILDEYMRECYGEGQYFYQLKRRGVSSVKKQHAGETIMMGEPQYTVPLPDSEIKYRD